MSENALKPLKLFLHGMDNRAVKKMIDFLQADCSSAALLVSSAEDADLDIFDADIPSSKKLLQAHLKKILLRPAIVLSLKAINYKEALHLRKPLNTEDTLAVLNQARTLAIELKNQAGKYDESADQATKDKEFIDYFNDELFGYIDATSWEDEPVAKGEAEIYRVAYAPENRPPPAVETRHEPIDEATTTNVQADNTGAPPDSSPTENDGLSSVTVPEETASPDQNNQGELINEDTALPQLIINQDNEKTSSSSVAEVHAPLNELTSMDEKGFYDYIDAFDDMDFMDDAEPAKASYSPSIYFQGYFQLALKSCLEKNKSIMLQSDWCPIALLPFSQEVWLEASESEVKAFSEIRIKHKSIATEITAVPIDPKQMRLDSPQGKFHSMQSFLWKLACWTSKGRYPEDIVYDIPVYISEWPNLTRLLLTPHALRIAALLIKGPRTMANIAVTLNIKPQHVFVFVSAAHAIGILGQARRAADTLIAPHDPVTGKNQSSFDRVMDIFRKKKDKPS